MCFQSIYEKKRNNIVKDGALNEEIDGQKDLVHYLQPVNIRRTELLVLHELRFSENFEKFTKNSHKYSLDDALFENWDYRYIQTYWLFPGQKCILYYYYYYYFQY